MTHSKQPTSVGKRDELRPTAHVPAWIERAYAEPERRSRKYVVPITITAIVLALVGVYLVGVHHYQSHFLRGITVGGIDASGMTEEELSKQIKDNIDAFTLHVSGQGADFDVTAGDAALAVDADAIAKSALSNSNPYRWPISTLRPEDVSVEVGVTYDQATLDAAIASKVDEFNKDAKAPTDAGATWSNEKAAFVPTPCAVGTQLDKDVVSKQVSAAVSSLKTKLTIGEDALIQPTIKDNDASLAEAIDRLNTISKLSIPLTFNGETRATADPALIRSWLQLAYADGSVRPNINTEAIENWSRDNLNQVVNGENEVRGWEVSSQDVANALAPKIMGNDGSALEVPTVTTFERPAESEGHESRGRHIDINLSSQYARLYDTDGKTVLWRSGVVSGDEAKGHSTPTGDYEINSMERDVVLKGLKDGVKLNDGEQPKEEDYYNSNVNYWMCFLGNAYGLHDATWRGDYEFGSDAYQYDGSHGCVNLPYDAAAELYGLIHVGEKVHIHY